MRVALVDTVKNRKYYPLPFLKIGAWLKDEGHECQIFNNRLPESRVFDEIWITTVFTFDVNYSLAFVREAKKRADKVIVGGIAATLLPEVYKEEGVEVFVGLHSEAEKYSLDYSILNHTPEYSVTHTSRGCIRKCEFCMVKEVEPKFYNRLNWERDIHPDSKKIVFYDNNWSAKPNKIMREDTEKIHQLMKSQGILSVDFNQSIDCRVITPEKADIISSIPIKPIRLAFDSVDEKEPLIRTIRLLHDRGEKRFMIDMLYNFKDKPQDIYYRARAIAALREELNIAEISIFPMKYAPIKQIDSRRFVGRYWSRELLTALSLILSCSSVRGTISQHSLEEFEYWYGRNQDEFIRLLRYPKIRELMKTRLARSRKIKFGRLNNG